MNEIKRVLKKEVVPGSSPGRLTIIWGIRIEVSIADFQSADTGALPVYPTNLKIK